MNQQACQESQNKYLEQNPELNTYAKEIQKEYYDPLSPTQKFPLGAAGVIYKRELKFGVYKGWYVDIRDQGRYATGFIWRFP